MKKVLKKFIHYYWNLRALFFKKNFSTDLRKVVIFFLPESGIQSYINTMLVVASQLKLLGHKVLFIRCFSVLDRCVFMDSVNLDKNSKTSKKELCTQCFSSFQNKIIKFGFDYIDLRNFTEKNDHQEINNVILTHPDKPFFYQKDGIQFTEILKYNFFLYNKSTNLIDLDSDKLKLWQDNLRTLYVGYKSFLRISETFDISHVFMIDEYSFNLVIKEVSEKKNIIFKSLLSTYHKDISHDRVKIIHKNTLSDLYYTRDEWFNYRDINLSAHDIKDITDDLIVKMSQKGTYSYSPEKINIKDLLSSLNLSKEKKNIVAFTSSPDEVEALLAVSQKSLKNKNVNKDAFFSQIDWLTSLIQFVEKSEDFQLIVRLHPRLTVTHRESIACDALSEFKEKLKFNYKNTKIIWPENKMSSYDIAEIADIATIAWSSMGVDMSRLSIPVISGFANSIPLINDKFFFFLSDREKYFEKLVELKNVKMYSKDILLAYRWYKAVYLGYSVDLSDIFEKNLKGKFELSKNSKELENSLIYNENTLQNKIKSNNLTENINNELEQLKIQFARVIYFLITNKDCFFQNYCQSNVNEFLDCIFVKDALIKFTSKKGIKYEKYSPLVLRLLSVINS